MAHMIESAKSSRASCRVCKKPIEKGTLRFGEEVANAFSPGEMTYQWHHLECAAQKKPAALKQALENDDNEVAVPNKSALLETIATSGKTEKPTSFPYAEHAPTARASCISCGEKIDKGQLRVAVETELNAGGFMRKGAGYLHPGCASDHTGEEPQELFGQIQANSLNLEQKDLEVLEEEMVLSN